MNQLARVCALSLRRYFDKSDEAAAAPAARETRTGGLCVAAVAFIVLLAFAAAGGLAVAL